MKPNKAWTINSVPETSEYWFSSQKHILILLTAGGLSIILLWHLFESVYTEAFNSRMPWLLWTAVATFCLNLVAGLTRNTSVAFKQHLIAGFYLGTVFCLLLVLFTGAGQSPYWFGPFFIIVAWFVLIPFSFREMILHSLAFVFIFIVGQFVWQGFAAFEHEMAKVIFLYSVTLIVSFFATYIRKNLDTLNVKIKKELENKNQQLLTTNKQLVDEIESHKITTRRLLENKKFLNNILSNAPIQIWGIDLEGKFTYPESRSGQSVFELYKDAAVEKFLRKVLANEILSDIIEVDGIYYDSRVSPVFNENGIKTGYLGVSLDITKRVKSEKELRKFRLVLDQAPGAVFIIDKNSKFEYINPYFTKLSGYTEEDLLHKNISETLYKGIDEIPESRKEIVRTLREGNIWQGNLLTVNKNGTNYWANTLAAPFKNEQGEMDGFLVIQQDITEKMYFERAIQESEAKYKTLVENSQDGILITQNGKFKFVNNALCRMLGYTQEEFQRMNELDIVPEQMHHKLFKINNDRKEGRRTPASYSLQLISKGKQIIEVEVQSNVVEFKGETAVFTTLHDVTESKKMQQALLISEKKYRELAEMLPQSVYELDTNGRITYMNQTGHKKFGISVHDYGRSAFDFIASEQHDLMRKNMAKSISENYHTQGTHYTAVKKDGTTFPVMIFASPLFENGKVTGTRGIILDMSSHIAMENALKQSEEKYRLLIEKAVDGIIIIQNSRLKFVNQAFCELMQYNAEDLIDQSYFDYVEPEDHELMNLYHRRRMAGEDFQAIYRSRIRRKDGKILHIELNTRTSEFNGQPAAFIIVRDITQRLKIEEELRIAKEKLEALNQNLEISIREKTLKLTEANTQLIRLQKENLQSQFEVLRQQVNPHFLFNSLNVLTSLIKLEPDLAEKFTEHLSKVYRYVLENKDNELVNLQTELDFLDAYVFLLNIRFMNKIEVNVNIGDDKKKLKILPLALQLLIENAIKHNSMSKKNPLKINIYTENKNTLTVENNLQERESHMASTGVGLKNIEHRYHLLEMPAPQFYKTETKFIARIPLKADA